MKDYGYSSDVKSGSDKKITPDNNPKSSSGAMAKGTSVARGGKGNADHNPHGRSGMPRGKGRGATGF